ncbi:MAG: pyridoxamine 5'-phosphate oxidase family protein [Muribaculaceae bacterium]|nr:pyridoxamine 5'-phosphate oxidase family protein [Muribaculaceae bacterium]
MERKMRRFKQELPETEVLRILNEGKVAVWAVDGDEDYPYAVPVNYVYHDGFIYIHSAAQGHKIDAIRRNPKCSLCIVDKDEVVPAEFTSYFRSVIAFGRAGFVESEEEKIEVLRLLCEKYSPGIDPTNEINKFLKVVAIIKIIVEKATGKQAIELVQKI